MGVMDGYEQKQIYVEDGLWPLVVVLSQRLNLTLYELVNQALDEKLRKHFSASELRALRTMMATGHRKARRHSARKPRGV